jgi:gliding motility-associated-like protein
MGQDMLGVKIVRPDSVTTQVNHLAPGNLYIFFWNLPDKGCGLSTAIDSVRVLGPKPNAGSDNTYCSSDSCIDLLASNLYATVFETGVWTSNDTTLKFTNAFSNQTTVCNLKQGDNYIFWTTNGGRCGNMSRDTVDITYLKAPTAVDDQVTVAYGHKIDFNVLANDILPPDFSFQTKPPLPMHGILDSILKGTFTYQPYAGFTGSDELVYQVCNRRCTLNTGCSTAVVTITVEQQGECIIPTIITPNNDNKNDVFVVPASCLSAEGGQMGLKVFNEWGDLVFAQDPYQNDWGGTYNNQPLPAGTYFFILTFDGGATIPVRKGFLIIQR